MKRHWLGYIILLYICFTLFYSCDKDVSVTPPDEPPPKGTLNIDSYPSGAKIYLNGKFRVRRTPDSLTWLEETPYEITLKKEFFRDTSVTVTPSEEERINIFIDYSKNKGMLGSLVCSSYPQGSEIFLNDSGTGKVTPYKFYDMLPGIYSITYKHAGHETATFKDTVWSSQESEAFKPLINRYYWDYYNTSNSDIPSNNLRHIAIDLNDYKWIGVQGRGLIFYDGQSWTEYHPGLGLASDTINAIGVDNAGIVWVCTPSGLTLATPGKLIPYNVGSRYFPIPYDNITSVAAYSDLDVYFGCAYGLMRLRKFSDIWKWDYYIPYNSGIPHGDITVVAAKQDEELWLGFNLNYVAVKRKYQDYKTYGASDGVTKRKTSAIAVSPFDGSVWVGHSAELGSGGGVSKYAFGTWEMVKGLPNTDVETLFADSMGRIWIATHGGLVMIHGYNTQIFTYNNTGLMVDHVTGFAEDYYGQIWMTTEDGGIAVYKQ